MPHLRPDPDPNLPRRTRQMSPSTAPRLHTETGVTDKGKMKMFGWMKEQRPPHRMAEIGGLYEGAQITQHGLVIGTLVASHMGWRPVEALAPGDMVLTFDHGMVPVREVRRTTLFPCATSVPSEHWPLHVPAGALANAEPMTLLPDQAVMVESDAARDANGDPFALVAAKVLDGLRGIARTAPLGQIDLVTLVFDTDQVIYAQGGALAFCPCPHIALDDVIAGAERPYDVLGAADAAFLAGCMAYEDGAHTAP